MKQQLRERPARRPLIARLDPVRGRSARSPRRRSARDRVVAVAAVLALLGLSAVVVRDTLNSPIGEATPAQTPDQSPPAVHDEAGHSLTNRTPPAPNPDPKLFDVAKASAELPPGGDFTAQGAKKWSIVPGAGPAVGGSNRVTYTVEIEDGLQLVGGPETFAADVSTILADPRGWIGDKQHGFQRVDSGKPDLRVRLTSQMTTRDVCGFSIPFEGSCVNGNNVTINVARWVRGAVAFQGALVEYKQYVINHEVGHGLGYDHKPCQENGGLAPVMMQQSWGISNDYLAALGTDRVTKDGKVCKPNAWPYPTGS